MGTDTANTVKHSERLRTKLNRGVPYDGAVSGYLEKRENGVYRISVEGPRDPLTGKRTRVRRTVRGTKKDAEAELAQMLLDSPESAGNAHSTLGSLLEQWADTAAHTIAPTTFRSYLSLAQKHIIPALGDVKIKNLTAHELDRFYAALITRRRLSTSTVRQVHVVIRRALQQAVQWGWLTRNVAELATVPRQEKSNIIPPTIEEVGRLIEVANERDGAFGRFLVLSATTGARRGEVCALRWKHVDLARSELLIEASIAEFEGLIEKDTKTHASRRIALDHGTIEMLKEQRTNSEERARRYGYHISDDSYVFSDFPDGSRPWAPGWVTHTFAQVRESAGLTRVRLHDLRHFAATLLMARGVPVRSISALRISAGSGPLADDDGVENSPVGFAGVEECADAVTAEIPEPKTNSLDALDKVVQRLGGAVGDPRHVVVADLVEPRADGSPELLDFGWHGSLQAVVLDLREHGARGVDVVELVEVTQALLDHVGNDHLTVRVTEFQ